MRKLKLSMLSLTIVALLLSGCGSGTSDSNSTMQSNVTSGADSGGGATSVDGFYSKEYTSGSSSESTFRYDIASNDYSSDNYEDSYEYDTNDTINTITEDTSVDMSDVDTGDTQEVDMSLAEEKLVYNCNMSIETLDYQDTMDKIQSLVEKYSGVVQYMYEYDNANGWYMDSYVKNYGTLECSMKIRVPSKNYNDIVNGLGDVGKIKSKQASIQNISQEYYDTEKQIEGLEKELDRLLTMMDQAYSIEDMITVESRISTVESQLMQLKTDIKYMDMDVAYSYIDISIKEVMEYTEDAEPVKVNTFLDRLYNKVKNTWEGLLDNLEDVLFVIIGIFPYLLIVIAIIILYRVLFKKKVKEMSAKREAQRRESGNLSIKDMGKLISELSDKLNDKDTQDNNDDTESKDE